MIKLTNLQKIYRTKEIETVALENVNLEVQQGEFLSIMGPSGCGKSTLLNIMGLLDLPTSGTVEINGVNTVGLSDKELAAFRNKQLGFVFQSFHLVPRLTAAENIALPMTLAGIAPAERQRRVARALSDFGLDNRADHKPDQLSGGQRQRVAIARATIMQPAMILADEPTGNLDSHTSEEIMALFQALNAEGITIVLVTHEHDIAAHARRQRPAEDGPPRRLSRRPPRPGTTTRPS